MSEALPCVLFVDDFLNISLIQVKFTRERIDEARHLIVLIRRVCFGIYYRYTSQTCETSCGDHTSYY